MNALHAFSSELLRQCAVDPRPAVNVDLLAHQLGVRIRERHGAIGEMGRVRVSGVSVEVQLRPGLPPGRRRFVLTHELGHILCADPAFGTLALRRQLRLDEERFCDRFSESVLLPAPWLRKRFASRGPALALLFACAQEARVSAAAASVGLYRVAGWKRTLLRLQRGANDWRLLSITGHLPVAPGQLRTSSALSRLLDGELAPSGGRSRTVVPLTVLGSAVSVHADAFVAGRRAFLLVDLRDLADSRLSRSQQSR